MAGVGLADAGDRFGRAGGDDAAALHAAFGAEVYDVVGALYHVEVVLDDDDGVAQRDEALEDVEQLVNVREVQTRGRLVEDVDGSARRALGEFARELDALRLAARKRCGRLAELDVAEADVEERLELLLDLRDVL